MFEVAATCLVLTALFAYLNHRFVGLPDIIGITAIIAPGRPIALSWLWVVVLIAFAAWAWRAFRSTSRPPASRRRRPLGSLALPVRPPDPG